MLKHIHFSPHIYRLKNNLQVCAVKAPGFGDNRKNTMKDMAVSTGALIMNDENEMNKLEDITEDMLGSAKEVVITKDDTLIMKVCRPVSMISHNITQPYTM